MCLCGEFFVGDGALAGPSAASKRSANASAAASSHSSWVGVQPSGHGGEPSGRSHYKYGGALQRSCEFAGLGAVQSQQRLALVLHLDVRHRMRVVVNGHPLRPLNEQGRHPPARDEGYVTPDRLTCRVIKLELERLSVVWEVVVKAFGPVHLIDWPVVAGAAFRALSAFPPAPFSRPGLSGPARRTVPIDQPAADLSDQGIRGQNGAR